MRMLGAFTAFLLLSASTAHDHFHGGGGNEKELHSRWLDYDELDVISPLTIPRMNREQKWALIRSYGGEPILRHRVRKGARKVRRDILLHPWRITHVVPKSPPRPKGPAMALPVEMCPPRFDAVTRGFIPHSLLEEGSGYNGRIYVFAQDRVFQVWFEDGLPQKSSFLITELFPGGPRSVTAAVTNSRSGVTILFDGRKAYRFRWGRKNKRFFLARNTPQDLPYNITITPQGAFEWMDSNIVLFQGAYFVTYDAFWNVPTFEGITKEYFPGLPKDLIGITYNGEDTLLLFTSSNKLEVYNTKKYRVTQEYPLKVNEYVGCISR